jgi:tetratricopeptide (TPR) repeat protein
MEKIVELAPKDDETRFMLSQHYFEAQDFESAIAHLEVCTELQPKNANYHLGLAMALGEDGRTKEAEASYKATLKLNPDDAAANNNLACIYLAAGRKDNEMFSLAKKAQSLDPQRSTFLDTLGWAYYVRGKNAEAREYIEASYKKEADPEVAYHYGCVMMDLGFLDDAERLLKESLNEQSPGWKNDANKRLKRIEYLRRQGARSKKRAAAKAPKKLVKPESKKETPKPAPKKVEPKKAAPKKSTTSSESRLDAFKKRVSGEKKAEAKKDEKKAEEKKEKRTRER